MTRPIPPVLRASSGKATTNESISFNGSKPVRRTISSICDRSSGLAVTNDAKRDQRGVARRRAKSIATTICVSAGNHASAPPAGRTNGSLCEQPPRQPGPSSASVRVSVSVRMPAGGRGRTMKCLYHEFPSGSDAPFWDPCFGPASSDDLGLYLPESSRGGEVFERWQRRAKAASPPQRGGVRGGASGSEPPPCS